MTIAYPHHLDDLRTALALDGLAVGQHRRRIEEIGHQKPHTIVWQGNAMASTCVPYALGLEHESVYAAVAMAYPTIFAGRDFVEGLLRSRLDELADAGPSTLALYFAEDRWALSAFTVTMGV